jgi:hypothetical protein
MPVVVNPLTAGFEPTYSNANTTSAVMTSGLVIFTTTGDLLIFGLMSVCSTANGATASTLQYTSTNNTTTTTANISAASASLANAAAGVVVTAQLGAVSNAPTVSTAAGVSVSPWGGVRVPGNSSIKVVIGVGSTTGTWSHFVHWEPLQNGAILIPAF